VQQLEGSNVVVIAVAVAVVVDNGGAGNFVVVTL